jgi:PAS domain S-box-containing protein
MKLRIILLVLSLLAFLSASSGGYIYYSSLKAAAFNEAERQAATRVEMAQKNLSFFLSQFIDPVKAMTGMDSMQTALETTDAGAFERANQTLDYFNYTFDTDVCYLMDGQGTTVASSNRHFPDSFMQQNFSFRPYFQKAMEGIPATYLALGTTSGKRGAYYSHPVYAKDRKTILGVAVIKASIEQAEGGLHAGADETIFVTDPNGVIFISSRQSWLYRLWKAPGTQEMEYLSKSHQFGDGPWVWVGLALGDDGYAHDGSGTRYLLNEAALKNYPGWHVHYLQSLESISRRVFDPLIRTTGPIVLSLCFLVGISVFLLYNQASRYSKDLERQVRKRTGEIDSILRYTPDVVSIKDCDGHYLLVNTQYERLFGVRNEEIRGKTDSDIHSGELAEQFRRTDRMVLLEKRSSQVEELVPQKDGIHTYLSVKFPIYDDSGAATGVGSISTDITALKKAQDRLRRLSARIMSGQEQERGAIARELHDQLGQMLTALNMDAVWLQKRLNDADPDAALRAFAMCSLIDETIDDVRGMVLRLRPKLLDDLGLLDALEWYTADFEKRTEITSVLRHDHVPGIRGHVATAAYRITQEALTNVARHSFANLVEIDLTAGEGMLSLEIEDNGRGFNTLDLSESEGLGIAGMRERATLAGGVLEVESRQGQGTRVFFKVPLNEDSMTDHDRD